MSERLLTVPRNLFSATRLPLWAAILAALLLSACEHRSAKTFKPLPTKTTLESDTCVLPSSFSEFEFAVTAKINGKGPFRLKLDTGTTGIILSARSALAAGLEPSSLDTHRIPTVSGDIWGVPLRIESLDCGGLSLTDLDGIVMSEPDWVRAGMTLHQSIDGVLGIACLHDVVVTLDYPHKQVRVSRPNVLHLPADRALPFTGPVPQIVVTIDGKQVPVFIDTGNNETLAVPRMNDLDLDYNAVAEDGFAAFGQGNQVARNFFGALKEPVTAGPYVWHDMFVTDRRDPTIGYGALSNWAVVIDGPANKVYFMGQGTQVYYRKDPAPVLGFYCLFDGSALRVVDVTPGQFIDRSNIKIGDVILAVDGVPAAFWATTYKAAAVLRQPTVVFNIVRNSQELTVTVKRDR